MQFTSIELIHMLDDATGQEYDLLAQVLITRARNLEWIAMLWYVGI